MRYAYWFKRGVYGILVFWATTVLVLLFCKKDGTAPLRIWFAERSEEGLGFYEFASSSEARLLAKEWKLDLPLFYIGISAYAEPDTLYRIIEPDKRKTITALLSQNGDWEKIQDYFQVIAHTLSIAKAYKPQSDTLSFIREKLSGLPYTLDETLRTQATDSILFLIKKNPKFIDLFHGVLNIRNHANLLKEDKFLYKNYIPKINFYGFKNQYHHWLTCFMSGDLGKTYKNRESIPSKLSRHIQKSGLISLLAFCMVYTWGILFGIIGAVYPRHVLVRLGNIAGLMLNAIPSFMLGIFLIFLLANQNTLLIFTYDFQAEALPFYRRIPLPLLAYSLGGILSIGYLVSIKMKQVLASDYIRTACAKGLPPIKRIGIHALKNILPPLITSAAALFPGLLSGSIVLEKLFNVGGMGEAILEAVETGETGILMAVVAITTLLTVFGYLLTDLVNSMIDKRLQFG